LDVSGATFEPPELWQPIIIRADEIDAEIDRLASIPQPSNGRRESLFVHPQSTGDGPGLAPGIQVKLSVLLPGERTAPIRHTSTLINFCVRGSGTTMIGRKRVDYGQYDVFNTPSYRPYVHVNDTDAIHVRFTYSNAALLEKLRVHVVEEDPTEAEEGSPAAGAATADPTRINPFGSFELNDSGAMLMPYETLINPPAVDSPVLQWTWSDVKAYLDKLDALGADYVGRRLFLLYNPMTGRTNGTTPGFFATITMRPPGIVDRPHRHVSAAVNYFLRGRGFSRVAGKRYDWQAGDLMLSAPGWAIHNHASQDERVYELTVQDQPFHIAMESLLWQENLKHAPVLLGYQPGFATNRGEL
jgi:gentisate 1,2-dioxygenase